MSNFTGVTFAQQKVLPSDDAIIRRNILSDGILYGCEFSYSGSTLTMGAGQLLICGRQIRHPSAQNWAVTDATSGFARLVLTVDLTKTASKDVFEQVLDSVQYASSKDGFPALNQSDVNTTGSVYQIAACTVSLGAGGITGIIDQVGPCEVAGGGGLNFKLVGGLTQPTDPAENTIWVNTDFEVTGYVFSTAQPTDLTEGMIWVYTGTSSHVAFNALKKENIQVYPILAKQVISGALVDVEVQSYQNGEWVEWVDYIVNNGVTDYNFSVIDKTWNAGNSDGGNSTTVTQQDGYISVKGQKAGYGAAYVEKDLTGKKSITIEGTFPVNANSLLAVWSSVGAYVTANMVASVQLSATGATLNIQGLSGKMLVGITTVYTNEWKIVDMYLE